MNKSLLVVLCCLLLCFYGSICRANKRFARLNIERFILTAPQDTVPPADAMAIVTKIVYSLNKFDIDAVAGLYTPNAVVSDDEPPYSWNGPTAGIQWVNAVEQVCKDNKITKLKGAIEPVNVYQQNGDNLYIVVPVTYAGNLPGKGRLTAEGAFTFVLRIINGKWFVKSQAWMPKRAI